MQTNVTDELLQQLIIQKEKLTPLDAQKQLVNKANDIILLAKSVDNTECLQTSDQCNKHHKITAKISSYSRDTQVSKEASSKFLHGQTAALLFYKKEKKHKFHFNC